MATRWNASRPSCRRRWERISGRESTRTTGRAAREIVRRPLGTLQATKRSDRADGRGEDVRGAGGEGPRVVEGVGGLDADHGRPLVVAEVGKGPGLVDPGIPDDGAG